MRTRSPSSPPSTALIASPIPTTILRTVSRLCDFTPSMPAASAAMDRNISPPPPLRGDGEAVLPLFLSPLWAVSSRPPRCRVPSLWIYVISVRTHEGQKARVLPFLTIWPRTLRSVPPNAGHGICPKRTNFHLGGGGGAGGFRVHTRDPWGFPTTLEHDRLHWAPPRGGRPLGSGRQLPPQLTVGRRPLGGGAWEGGSRRGDGGGLGGATGGGPGRVGWGGGPGGANWGGGGFDLI